MCGDQHPVFFSYRDPREEGWPRSSIDTALRTGEITRVRRGVYGGAAACAPAIAAATHGGALHCVSAARHEGLWVLSEDERPHVGIRAGDHEYEHAECECTVHWDERPTVDSFGLPSVPRMLRQILRCRGVEDFFTTLESAMRQGKIDADGLRWLETHTNETGREALRMARWDADSGLESLVRWRLRAYGLEVRTQVEVTAVGRVDLVIGDILIVEVDGKANHEGESLRHKDLVRDANAAAWGYVTLRFDYALVVHDWDLVERAILAQIGRARR